MRQDTRSKMRHLAQGERGQVLLILAGGFVVLLVVLGLALDLGLMYIERVKLGRACDAAALAGAQELPYGAFAVRRAMEYLAQNGYDPTNTELITYGPSDTTGLSWAAPANSRGTIIIDTESYEDPNLNKESDQDNSAGRIRVHGSINVDMYFMKFIGFTTVPVDAQAIAENASNVDVVLVYDQSDSMNDDTYCYRDGSEGPCYIQDGQEYPEGVRLTLPYTQSVALAGKTLDPVEDVTSAGDLILVAEAEYYSYSTSYRENPYYRDYWELPDTFWTLQRVEGSQASGISVEAGDMRGAHMMHMPHRAEIPGHATTSGAPRLDYAFELPPSSGQVWYLWVRGQCGNYATAVNGCVMHWGVNGGYVGSTGSGDFGGLGGEDAGSIGNEWVWKRLVGGSGYSLPANNAATPVTINIWGGGPGFRLDKLLLTTNHLSFTESVHSYPDKAPPFIRDNTPGAYDNSEPGPAYQTYERFKRYGGPGDTGGRTGTDMALDECNPIYGLRVDLDGNGVVNQAGECDNTADDMFDDEQPLRAAQEAAKNFVKRMRAHHDQLGFVAYSRQYDQYVARELQCLLTPARGMERMPAEQGICVPDPETNEWSCDLGWVWCFDHRLHDGGTTGPRDTNTTSGSVIGGIEDMTASLETNTGDGMREALDVLFYGTGHYGRTYATKVMVMMTDGVANRWPTYNRCPVDSCCAVDLYQPNDGTDDENKAADCVIYYANEARARNVIIFTIGLGIHADHDLLKEVADITGGLYYYAPKARDLDWILQQIADQILLRLVE